MHKVSLGLLGACHGGHVGQCDILITMRVRANSSAKYINYLQANILRYRY